MPDIGVSVLPRAFSVETVGLRNAPRLMVSSNQMYPVWIPQLETYKQGDSLYAKQTPIDIVAWAVKVSDVVVGKG